MGNEQTLHQRFTDGKGVLSYRGLGEGLGDAHPPSKPQAYLALDEHVEELVAWLLGVPVATQVPQVVVGDTQPRQAAHAGPLVVQPAALGAGDEVKELLGVRGGCQRGLGCREQGVSPGRGLSAGTLRGSGLRSGQAVGS